MSWDKNFSLESDEFIMKYFDPAFSVFCVFISFPSSETCNFLRSPAFSKSKFNYLMVHKAQYSNLIGKWQAFSNTNLYGDIPRIILKAVL